MRQVLKIALLFTFAVIIVACRQSASNHVQIITNEKQDALYATLSIENNIVNDEGQLIVRATIKNYSAMNQQLLADEYMSNPILSLIISDEAGDTLVTGPPPTPPSDMQSAKGKVLQPNEKYDVVFKGLDIFSPALTKGTYYISMRNMASNGVSFKIK